MIFRKITGCIALVCTGHLAAQQFDYIDTTDLARVSKHKPLRKELIIKTNPGSILFGHFFPVASEYKIVAEAVLSNRGSLHGGLSYYSMSPWLRSLLNSDSLMKQQRLSATDFVMYGFRFQIGYRYYLKDPTEEYLPGDAIAPGGFYLMPHYSWSFIDFKYKGGGYREVFYLQNITCNFGYQVLINDQWTLDMFVGLGYKHNRVYTDQGGRLVVNKAYGEEVPILFKNPVKINLGFMLGYRL